MGRVSSGVRGMRVSGDNEVVGMITMEPDSNNTVLVISENGYGKRTPLDAYTAHNRGGQGMKTINVTERTGELVGFLSVNDEEDLMIINRSGITLRIRVADIKEAGRVTQGVRLINLDKRGDVIASVCAVPTDPEDEAETVDGEELNEPISDDLETYDEGDEADNSDDPEDEAEE